MTPEEFRTAGHRLIDWIADYRTGLDRGPVLATTEPGQVCQAFSSSPPTEVRTVEDVIGELERSVVPGITQVQHPMHFGWFPSNASLASVLGDMASSGLGGLGISWESCPALTEVEEVVCDWMRQLTGLSENWSGTIQDTASTACLVALLSARERATGHSQSAGGLAGVERPPVVYTTEQAHSSVRKAALLAGYGADNLRSVQVDPRTYAMDPIDLRRLIEADIAENRQPAAVVASIGTTGVTAFDPLAEIVAIAAEHRIWVHVDAAMAGTAMLLPEYRHLWNGVEQADSLSWNPHKWMGTILDTSLYYVRDVEHLVRVMSTNPSYLRSAKRRRGHAVPGLGVAARSPFPGVEALVPPRTGRHRGHQGPRASGPRERPLVCRPGRSGTGLAGPGTGCVCRRSVSDTSPRPPRTAASTVKHSTGTPWPGWARSTVPAPPI